MMKDNQRKMIYTAMFAAIVVVLQFFVAIPLGPMFTITLTLVPVMLGAILFGPSSGAILGSVFGVVVATEGGVTKKFSNNGSKKEYGVSTVGCNPRDYECYRGGESSRFGCGVGLWIVISILLPLCGDCVPYSYRTRGC